MKKIDKKDPMSKYSDEQESQKAPPEPIKMGIEGKEVSDKVVLTSEEIKKRCHYHLQKLVLNYSPKETAAIMFEFIQEYYDTDSKDRLDVQLKRYVDMLHKREEKAKDKS